MFKEASLDVTGIFLLVTLFLSPFLGVCMPSYTECLLGKSFGIRCVCVLKSKGRSGRIGENICIL